MRILLIQLRRIGDVLMTTGAVRALREKYPHAHIAYLAEAPAHQAVLHNPRLNEVFCWPPRGQWGEKWLMLKALRRQKFDVVIDFFSNPSSAHITRWCGAPRRIGFAFRGRSWAYTDPLPLPPLPYSGQHKMGLLALLGVVSEVCQPEFFLHPKAEAHIGKVLYGLGVKPKDFLVILSPVSRREPRRWAPEHYAHLADVLIERYGIKVLFHWGPGEEPWVDQVRLHMVNQALPSYTVPRNLAELGALLNRANLFISNDNGPRHIAIALGKPTVGIFGQSFPENWTPPHQGTSHFTVAHDPGCKNQCTFPRCDSGCIRGIGYEAVQIQVESMLERLLQTPT